MFNCKISKWLDISMAPYGAVFVFPTLCKLQMRSLPGCFLYRVVLNKHS